MGDGMSSATSVNKDVTALSHFWPSNVNEGLPKGNTKPMIQQMLPPPAVMAEGLGSGGDCEKSKGQDAGPRELRCL